MSDLTDEMRQLADNAASHARPLAVAEVIRRGNRRRTRTIAQRSIGGLSAVGLGAAILFTGTTASHSNPAASGTRPAGNTATATTSSPAGVINLRVRYQILRGGKIRLESVTYSGDAKKAVKRPVLTFTLGPSGPNGSKHGFVFIIGTKLPAGIHAFKGALSAKTIIALDRRGAAPGNESFVIGLRNVTKVKPRTEKFRAVMSTGVILTSR